MGMTTPMLFWNSHENSVCAHTARSVYKNHECVETHKVLVWISRFYTAKVNTLQVIGDGFHNTVRGVRWMLCASNTKCGPILLLQPKQTRVLDEEPLSGCSELVTKMEPDSPSSSRFFDRTCCSLAVATHKQVWLFLWWNWRIAQTCIIQCQILYTVRF